VSGETSDKRQIEATAVHLAPGKVNAVRAAFKAGAQSNHRRSPGSSACPRPTCGRRWRAGDVRSDRFAVE
jgi:hypothetical protein